MERQFNACQTPLSMYLSIFNSFWVIRCLNQCASPKIAIFTNFFPGAITLNIVWMEREFDAYKLSRSMCPSNYNRFWDTARYLWKNCHFIIPLALDAPVRGVPVGISPSRLVWKNQNGWATRQWKKIEDICNCLGTILACDRQTDRQTSFHGIYVLCIRIVH